MNEKDNEKELAEALIPYLKEALKEDYPDADYTVHTITKLGNITLTGICVSEKDAANAPVVYLNDETLEAYENGCPLHELAGRLADRILKSPTPPVDFSVATDYEAIKDRIVFRLIDARPGMNDDYLANKPHRKLGDTDIAIAYCIDFTDREKNCFQIMVTDGLLHTWNKTKPVFGITEQTLYDHALENTPDRRPYRLFVVCSLPGIRSSEPDAPDAALYALTSIDSVDGAAVILYPEMPEALRKAFPHGCYLLPSSRHEWIVVDKAAYRKDAESLREIVRAVNSQEVAPEDRLGEDVFELKDGVLISAFAAA